MYRSVSLFSLRICKDRATATLLRKDNCRSARIFTDTQKFSVQIFQEKFTVASGNQCIAFLGLLQQVFLLTEAKSVETLNHSKFLSRKACHHHGNFGVWGIFGIRHTVIYLFHSNIAEAVSQF